MLTTSHARLDDATQAFIEDIKVSVFEHGNRKYSEEKILYCPKFSTICEMARDAWGDDELPRSCQILLGLK